MNEFPDTIYQTHDNWGNVSQYADWDTMWDIVGNLRDLNEGWEDVSVSDCEEHKFIQPLDEGRAAYEGGWITDGYNRNGRREIVIFKPDEKYEGYFVRVDSFDSLRDKDEIQELGIEL